MQLNLLIKKIIQSRISMKLQNHFLLSQLSALKNQRDNPVNQLKNQMKLLPIWTRPHQRRIFCGFGTWWFKNLLCCLIWWCKQYHLRSSTWFNLPGQRMTKEVYIGFTTLKRTLSLMKRRMFCKCNHPLPDQNIKRRDPVLGFWTEKSLKPLHHHCLDKWAVFGQIQCITSNAISCCILFFRTAYKHLFWFTFLLKVCTCLMFKIVLISIHEKDYYCG